MQPFKIIETFLILSNSFAYSSSSEGELLQPPCLVGQADSKLWIKTVKMLY